jgi:hypothetical protein
MTPGQRRTLVALADVLIPARGDMPAASEVDIAGRQLDLELRARPDFAEALPPILDELAGRDPADAIESLERERPGDLMLLLQAVAGGYYMHEEVRRALGYPGQEALTLSRGGFGGEDLIDPVLARGPIYRGTS